MAKVSVRELVDAGIHFGHRVSRWNPKMAPYIYGKRNLIHIIDLKETVKGMIRAKKFLTQIVAEGKDVLFVATKRQARAILEREAKRCNMPYVSERWLGGMLTNFRTIRERLKYLEQLEALEQSGEINTYSKKMISKINREKRKITRNLDGVRTMNRLPGAVFVVDPRREYIAVREARRLEIATLALMDTDSDPDEVDLVIPGNDDAMRAIEIVVTQMADAVLEGLANRAARPMTAEKMREMVPAEATPMRRPRGRRAGGAARDRRGPRKSEEKRGPDPMQIAERGAPRRPSRQEKAEAAETPPAEADRPPETAAQEAAETAQPQPEAPPAAQEPAEPKPAVEPEAEKAERPADEAPAEEPKQE